jgi:DNA-binding transcriptional ArsR family regulator
MIDIVTITKALADENRIRIISALKGRELCVCQLIELLELAPSTVSKHVSILKNARLIEGRKQGRWMYCRLAGMQAPACVKDTLSWVLETAGQEPKVRADKRRLEKILKLDPEVLCRRQVGGQGRGRKRVG